MSIFAVQRLVSNTFDVRLGANMNQAALNAANDMGDTPTSIMHSQVPEWPKLEKFNNDRAEEFSPYGNVSNPEYIWDQPTSDGQTAAFAIASNSFLVLPTDLANSFSVFLVAFADNAMEAKIELFEQIGGSGGTFVKATPQPEGLDEFLMIAGAPNTPAVGLTETQPFNWQNIRVYSTRFDIPTIPMSTVFRIVVSFEVTNYLIPTSGFNPAGLQFICDIYQDIDFS